LRRPDGSSDDISGSARWRSSRAQVLAVGGNGRAVGRRAGTVVVRARLRGRVGTARVTVARASRALRVDRSNPRYFADAAGRPVYLAGAHTWSDVVDNGVSDPPPRFNYRRYLDVLQRHDLNLIRLWSWEQAHWTAEIKGDYSFLPTVYQRTGPGVALDGKPRFDVTKFNDAYFARLRQRVAAARERGIYAMVMLFDGWSLEPKGPSLDNPWKGHPFNILNNVNGINGDPDGRDDGRAVHSLLSPSVTRVQEAYVRRVLEAVGDQSNVLFEISNESTAGSIAWQSHMVEFIQFAERSRPLQHPVGISAEWPGGRNADLLASGAAFIAPNGAIEHPEPSDGRKVVVADTDHLCGVCGDGEFPWKALTRGLNPLFMDEDDGTAVGVGARDGDPRDPAWAQMRRALGATRVVAERLRLARMKPQGRLASSRYCLADPSPGGSYLVFVPDGKSVTVDLSRTPGALRADWIGPDTGAVLRRRSIAGGAKRTLRLPWSAPAVVLIHRT
jgi:hypothetical protein